MFDLRFAKVGDRVDVEYFGKVLVKTVVSIVQHPETPEKNGSSFRPAMTEVVLDNGMRFDQETGRLTSSTGWHPSFIRPSNSGM